MIERRGYQPESSSSNRKAYDEVFLNRVHSLVKLGYDRLDSKKYVKANETQITGDLASGIEAVLEDRAEPWMPFFRVHDDPPLNTPRRQGKPVPLGKGRARSRVDIQFDSSETTPYTRFHFESKRLGPGYAAGKYLGAEGLGCYLSGDYAAEESRVGMLGYVQSDDEESWMGKLAKALTKDAMKYQLAKGSEWKQCDLDSGLTHTYETRHRRKKKLPPIRVLHSLLLFH